MKRTHEFIAEEAEWAEVPKGLPVVRSIRWALLHGEAFTALDVAERFNVSTSTLSVVAGDLRAAGWVLEETREGARKRFRVTGRWGEGAPPSAPKAQRRPRQAASRSVAPALGANVRVVMLAEDGDRIALVLVDEAGVRWPVVMDGGPL